MSAVTLKTERLHVPAVVSLNCSHPALCPRGSHATVAVRAAAALCVPVPTPGQPFLLQALVSQGDVAPRDHSGAPPGCLAAVISEPLRWTDLGNTLIFKRASQVAFLSCGSQRGLTSHLITPGFIHSSSEVTAPKHGQQCDPKYSLSGWVPMSL